MTFADALAAFTQANTDYQAAQVALKAAQDKLPPLQSKLQEDLAAANNAQAQDQVAITNQQNAIAAAQQDAYTKWQAAVNAANALAQAAPSAIPPLVTVQPA